MGINTYSIAIDIYFNFKYINIANRCKKDKTSKKKLKSAKLPPLSKHDKGKHISWAKYMKTEF